MRFNIRVFIAVRALVLCTGLLVGCATQQIEPPSTATESGDSSTGPEPTTSAATIDPTGGPTDTTSPADCEGPKGCFDCPPTRPIEVLNTCTDASCEPFPNTEQRLPLLNKDGTLPPLP